MNANSLLEAPSFRVGRPQFTVGFLQEKEVDMGRVLRNTLLFLIFIFFMLY